MSATDNSKAQVFVAVAVVLFAALISWKIFYHDPTSELDSLNSQIDALELSESSGATRLLTADDQTLQAAKKANEKLSSKELRERISKAAQVSGAKLGGVTKAGDAFEVQASGSATTIALFLSSLQGATHLEGDQIRGVAPFVAIGKTEIEGPSSTTETVTAQISSGT